MINLLHTFVHSILKYVHKGRIHAEINQIKSERGGTVTGRFLCLIQTYNNSLQVRTEQGNQIRSLFLPDEGHKWASFDYSTTRTTSSRALCFDNFQDAAIVIKSYEDNSNRLPRDSCKDGKNNKEASQDN